MSDRLDALRLFVRVARTRSFSRAAKELKISQATASRMVAGLERALGATLFARTTRALTLTEVGSNYLGRVQAVLDRLDEADHAARGTGELIGVLRIGCSAVFASGVIVPRLMTFMTLHPAMRVELLIDDKASRSDR